LKKASEALDGYIINSPDDIGMFKLRELPYAGSSTIEMLWYQVEWFSNLTKDQAGFIQDWWDEEGERKWATNLRNAPQGSLEGVFETVAGLLRHHTRRALAREHFSALRPRPPPMSLSIDAGTVKEYAVLFGALLSAIVFGTYWVPKLIVSLLPTQNLKKKYDAEWALVTGSSSGIGKSIAFALAKQGVNVVLVALQEPLLDETFEELKASFGDRKFLKIGVNLGAPGYVDKIADATKDIDVQLVFNNAGYMLTGFFDKTPLARLMMNHECNATSAMQITHVFVTRMLEKNKRGCVVFTSSAAACQPTPFSALYGATKAYVSSFAANIAVELHSRNIDVLAFHPSPVATNFYDKAHKLDALAFFMNFAVKPDALPREMFKVVGRAVWWDSGSVAVGFRMLLKVFDYGFFAALISRFAHTMSDYKKNV
jgi:short-subunit dehydrogenase